MKATAHFESLLPSDARILPAYSVAEASRYLRLPPQTLRNWVLGVKSVSRIIEMDDPHRRYLSFMNLVEAHVISGISRHYGVRLPQVRAALQYLRESLSIQRPLIAQEFKTDGKSLFIERFGHMIDASRQGQITMEALLTARLERIDRDVFGLPIQLHPFTRAVSTEQPAGQPKLVVINPLVSFGRPSLQGIATSVLWSRYAAGDSMLHLAEDYGLTADEIDEAIRCEAVRQAA
jgi:uncharacterized protein (DUF433 family)